MYRRTEVHAKIDYEPLHPRESRCTGIMSDFEDDASVVQESSRFRARHLHGLSATLPFHAILRERKCPVATSGTRTLYWGVEDANTGRRLAS